MESQAEQEHAEPQQEEHHEHPPTHMPAPKKKRLSLHVPSFLYGDRSASRDWQFGLTLGVTLTLMVFTDYIFAVIASVLLFAAFYYAEGKGRIA